MNDPFGEAIQTYLSKGKAPDIQINSNYTENETIPVSYLFRNEKQMPELEKLALKKCKGKILDVGAAAGCHSIVLQKKGFSVTALEKSELAVEAMKQHGIVKTVNADIFDYNDGTYNTILLLMNGAGIGGTMDGLRKLLQHLKTLLPDDGQILIDSSDIKYLFEEEDGSLWVDLANNKYYGEMEYEVTFKKSSTKFKWLFIDFENLTKIASLAGLKCHLVAKGDHYDYLAQLKI
ncbi:methyltransferase domain-containing protein [Prolixibacteraceae bacterium Z1-6]|uniref:Methyltransferase domain-containing protein n=1 Tax=Draconibacterium aestuarii TaxID=2998507 RepID=A0A9X3F9M8_9BACT|nr:methyltransferase domain-containing protein [Prolixibacteraceae bacterium Z1-6]